MTLAVWEWLGPALAGLIALAGAVFAWWRSREPQRRRDRRRKDNAEIADDVRRAAGGDADALRRVNERLRQWQAEDD